MSQLLIEPDAPTHHSNCPDCSDATVNVQGIRTCATCSWFER